MRRLLIVAGSDSGGGAGIQADIKTATMHGVYAMTAVTAITVQDTRGVHGVHVIPDEVIAEQMAVCLSDIGADAIKTGMLHSAGTIETVARVLAKHAPHVPLVVDPVMVAKGGAKLIDETAVAAMKRFLLPRATILTPNSPESAALLGIEEPLTKDDLARAGRAFLQMGPRAVMMKGGHLPGDEVVDVFVERHIELEQIMTADEAYSSPYRANTLYMESSRIHSKHTHGTGCTLATAIACGLASGRSLVASVAAARSYVIAALETAPGLGYGHGPLNHMHGLRS